MFKRTHISQGFRGNTAFISWNRVRNFFRARPEERSVIAVVLLACFAASASVRYPSVWRPVGNAACWPNLVRIKKFRAFSRSAGNLSRQNNKSMRSERMTPIYKLHLRRRAVPIPDGSRCIPPPRRSPRNRADPQPPYDPPRPRALTRMTYLSGPSSSGRVAHRLWRPPPPKIASVLRI